MSWYRLHRGWQDNAVFRNEAFSRRDAFVWLVENAQYKPAKVYAPKGEVSLDRGQLCHSLRFMAGAWKWDLAKVSRFITSLITAKIIDTATDTGQTVITICNYAKYQDLTAEGETASETAAIQQRDGGDTKKKERKKEKKEETYAFSGVVIHLTQAHYDAWLRSYSAIPDLMAELQALDDWLAGEPESVKSKWFFRVSGALKNKNREYIEAQKKASANGYGPDHSGIPL